MKSEITSFGAVLLFVLGAVMFTSLTLLLGKFIRPHRPNDEKNTIYESGESPVGNAWAMFNPKFYIIAIVFLLFEVEVLFLFPWSEVFISNSHDMKFNKLYTMWALIELISFIALLFLGLLYVWKKGFLDWKLKAITTQHSYQHTKIEHEMYQNINRKYAQHTKPDEKSFR
jgi:NADH-quinone oxidoreductase subunit A